MTKRKSTRPNRLADRYVRIRPQGGVECHTPRIVVCCEACGH